MIPPRESLDAVGETAVPGWVVFPQFTLGAPPRFEPLPKAEAFLRLNENSMNYTMLGEAGFDVMSDTVERCNIFEFTYGDLNEAVETIQSLAPPHA